MAKIRISGDTSGYVELAAPDVAGSDTITISSKTVSNPVGALMPFAGSTAPDGWLLCYGQEIAEASYPELFAIIGSTYNTGGESAGNFRVPDLRGRVVAGVDNMGGTAASRLTSTTITGGGDASGEVGGAQTHTLTTAEMPSHTHTQNPHNHTPSGGGQFALNRPVAGWFFPGGTGDLQANGGTTTANTTATNQNTGGGGAHNNVQPTMVLNYIICAGV